MATASTFEFNLDSNTNLEETSISYRRNSSPERSRSRRPKYSRSGKATSNGPTNGFHRRRSKKWAW